MRLLIARCTVDYDGRLTAPLPEAVRLIMVKADGCVAIHADGGLAGIHVCANTDWSLVLDSGADLVNFDAFAYFDRFILYGPQIRNFLDAGRLLAWGIVPTLKPEEIERETVDSLFAALQDRFRRVESLGIDPATLRAQSFITPSCGVGSLSLALAERVLELTRELSVKMRQSF